MMRWGSARRENTCDEARRDARAAPSDSHRTPRLTKCVFDARRPRGGRTPIFKPRCDTQNEAELFVFESESAVRFSDTQLASLSLPLFRRKRSIDATLGARTYCENVYLGGRHRQQWLCVGKIIQSRSHHPAGTEQLLSIWPLGGCTPSMQEGGITPGCSNRPLSSSSRSTDQRKNELRCQDHYYDLFCTNALLH